MRDEMRYNGSGYVDPTPHQAFKNMKKDTDYKARKLIKTLQSMTHLAGFEIVGRIVLRDKESGEEYR